MLPWRGTLIGFLFGTIGLWLLALLGLMLRVFELLGALFLAPGRWLASLVAGESASTGTVVALFLAVGVFYAAIGAVVELAYRKLRRE